MLPSKIVRNKAGRAVPLLLAALIFAGCSGQGTNGPGADIQKPATGTSGYYLQQMQQSGDDSKLSWQLLAIRALLNEGKADQAKQQLDSLPHQRSDDQQQEIILLSAQYCLLTKDIAGANALLNQANTDDLSKDQLARYYQMVIAAQQNAPTLQLIRAYIAQGALLTNPQDKQKNIDETWQALTSFTKAQRDSLVINANENVLQGWLDLLDTWRANQNSPDMLKAAISDWQTRYPDNPAAKMLPGALSGIQNFKQASTGKIALLLPLSGQAQVYSNAIEKGFNDARNGALNPTPAAPQTPDANAVPQQAQAGNPDQPVDQAEPQAAQPSGQASPDNAQQNAAQPGDQAQNTAPEGSENNPVVAPSNAAFQPDNEDNPVANTPPASAPAASPQPTTNTAPPSSSAQVQVYDTSNQPIDQVIAKAQQDGATMIVGPLLKDQVEKLPTLPTSVNILALNEPEQVQNRPNICYFALSPEDEARDAAHHMWDQGKRQPLLLLPRSSLGDRVANAFSEEWQKLGGATVLQQRFGSVAELHQSINSGAGIRLTGTPVVTQQQAPQQVTIAGLTIPAPASDTPPAAAGGNVDSVYTVATQSELQLIKPMIAMRVSSRDNIAMYASSRSYRADSGADFRFEMEGLQFSDAPLLTGANPALLAQAARDFNNDFSLVRLYVMGIDAWTLANHFNEMRQMPGFQINGDTGVLNATQDCVINRKLTWSQYHQGQIVPVN